MILAALSFAPNASSATPTPVAFALSVSVSVPPLTARIRVPGSIPGPAIR